MMTFSREINVTHYSNQGILSVECQDEGLWFGALHYTFQSGYGAKGIIFCVGELRKRYQTGMLHKHTYVVEMIFGCAFSRKIII